MNESNKNQNNIDQHPIATIREGVADGGNIALGIVFFFRYFIHGFCFN